MHALRCGARRRLSSWSGVGGASTAPLPSVSALSAALRGGRRLAFVTAYSAWEASLACGSDVDALLVGDSVMNVVYGARDTLGADVALMAAHVRAVAAGARGRKLIVADMPFLAVRRGRGAALDAAAALLRAGAHAVKPEGARGHADVIAHLVESGVPVVGHLGLTPQSVHALGGFRVQARSPAAAARLREDAAALAAAGVCALVLECVPTPLAAAVTADLAQAGVPTVGIGAGAGCAGQVLVLHDMLGLTDGPRPRFARQFADAGAAVRAGVDAYVAAVREGSFPDDATEAWNA
jgi:3-methyl-2-oxobutanoate hydroxymethyltransferase